MARAATTAAVALALVTDATTDTAGGAEDDVTSLGVCCPAGNACALTRVKDVKSDADGLSSGIVKNERKNFSEEE